MRPRRVSPECVCRSKPPRQHRMRLPLKTGASAQNAFATQNRRVSTECVCHYEATSPQIPAPTSEACVGWYTIYGLGFAIFRICSALVRRSRCRCGRALFPHPSPALDEELGSVSPICRRDADRSGPTLQGTLEPPLSKEMCQKSMLSHNPWARLC